MTVLSPTPRPPVPIERDEPAAAPGPIAARSPKTAKLGMEGVSVYYGQKRAVRDVNLSIPPNSRPGPTCSPFTPSTTV